MGEVGNTIGVASVGCSVLRTINTSDLLAAHGRAPAMATGIKRLLPEQIVFTYRAMATWPPSAWAKVWVQLRGGYDRDLH